MTIGGVEVWEQDGSELSHLGVRDIDRARQMGVGVVHGSERLDDGHGAGLDLPAELLTSDDCGHGGLLRLMDLLSAPMVRAAGRDVQDPVGIKRYCEG